MKLESSNFRNNQRIAGACAFAVPHATDHITLSANRNPQLAWSGAPAGFRQCSRSFLVRDQSER